MKTVEQINEKIRRKEAVVLTAEEVVKLAEKKSPGEIARDVDMVTTGTFSPMCSSGAHVIKALVMGERRLVLLQPKAGDPHESY